MVIVDGSKSSPRDLHLASQTSLLTDFYLFQNFSNTKNYLPSEMKAFFTPGKVR